MTTNINISSTTKKYPYLFWNCIVTEQNDKSSFGHFFFFNFISLGSSRHRKKMLRNLFADENPLIPF